MDRVIALMAILSLMLQPLSAIAGGGCDVASAPGLCAREMPEPCCGGGTADDRDASPVSGDRPADGPTDAPCHCPLPCCSIAKVPASLPVIAAAVGFGGVDVFEPLPTRSVRSSPHLLGLKRPPRA